MSAADSTYGPPVVRDPSPAESINTAYGEDMTSPGLKIMTEEEFARVVEMSVGLRRVGWETTVRPVLLPKPRTPEEERSTFTSAAHHPLAAIRGRWYSLPFQHSAVHFRHGQSPKTSQSTRR